MAKILLNPGPTNTGFFTKLRQWLGSDVCHRTSKFQVELEKLQKELLRMFDDKIDYPIVDIAIMGGSGTTALDSMISSLLPAGTAIINAGKYGQRAIEICETYNIKHTIIMSNHIDDLQYNENIKNLYFVENETTTGERYSLEQICKIYPNANLFIDATSAFGASTYKKFSDRIRALSFCSNKCLQSTPGLGIVIWKKDQKMYNRSFYGNLQKYGIGKMPFTVPVQSVYALREALKKNENSKNERVFDSRAHKIIVDFRRMGILCITRNPSNSIIAFRHPHMSYEQLRDFLEKRSIIIYSGVPGYENSFRVSTMSKKFDCKYGKIIGAFRDSCIH